LTRRRNLSGERQGDAFAADQAADGGASNCMAVAGVANFGNESGRDVPPYSSYFAVDEADGECNARSQYDPDYGNCNHDNDDLRCPFHD
jgi:hypothetical protein